MLLETIDMDKHFATCKGFRADSYYLSFGSDHGLDRSLEGYQARLLTRIKNLPMGNCHLWFDGAIIGQTEMKLVPDLSVGYVNLFYLTEAFRGLGLGLLLLNRAIQVFSDIGKTQLQLSVSASNQAALAFYDKHDFTSLGPKADDSRMLLMNLPLRQ